MSLPRKKSQRRQRDALELLRRSGLTVTPQRLSILQFLRGSADHPSAEMIYREVVKEFPSVSLTTVYNNLERFESVGLIHKVATLRGIARYEAGRDHHPHFICIRCGHIDHHMPHQHSLSALKKVKRPDFFIASVAVHFYGLCSACKETKVVRLNFMKKHLEDQRWPDVCRRWPTRIDLKGA